MRRALVVAALLCCGLGGGLGFDTLAALAAQPAAAPGPALVEQGEERAGASLVEQGEERAGASLVEQGEERADAPLVEQGEERADAPLVEQGEERARVETKAPLAGRRIVIDPGHQLGNHRFPAQINRQVPAGGFTKPCNTAGTATNGGYPEATFAWQVSRLVAARLRDLGATVTLTRHSNRQDRWGPCVDARGRAGNRIDADLKVSIHADGSYAAGARGFHVIAPADRAPWTDDIHDSSIQLASAVKAGLLARRFVVANYIAGGDGIDVRSDLGTLNLSDVPTVMVELGNMRSAAEAWVMTSRVGRARYARGVVAGVRTFLG